MGTYGMFSLKLSFQVAFVVTFFILLAGVPVSYVLARKNFHGKEILDALFTLPLVLPPTVTGYYLIVLLGRNGLFGRPLYNLTGWTPMFTWWAAAAASFVVSIPLMIRTSRAAIESVDEKLINASYTLGHGELKTALRVVLPLARKGILAGTVLSFARAIGEFGATLMFAGDIPGRTETMPLAIYNYLENGEWARARTMVIILTVLSVSVIYMANRLSKRI
ncbi:MAG: molybdate ABC transporter permease subunit [Nitrospiraceae bacterium]|nr:molybdate ABC transporter permease subunit [Nitrospiraceae bacterium]MDA8090902.1 molybdate ABC transporter permease subunit [Nitrospiraceae bacterium]